MAPTGRTANDSTFEPLQRFKRQGSANHGGATPEAKSTSAAHPTACLASILWPVISHRRNEVSMVMERGRRYRNPAFIKLSTAHKEYLKFVRVA